MFSMLDCRIKLVLLYFILLIFVRIPLISIMIGFDDTQVVGYRHGIFSLCMLSFLSILQRLGLVLVNKGTISR